MTQPAISVRNLSKCYKLGTIGRHTLVDEAQYLWHKIRGKDPRQHFGKIGHTATEARKAQAAKEGNQEFWALKDVSFDVQPGEVVGIIGGNGAGKSTLLKILTRITEPTRGDAFINGRVASLLEVGTGFHPELTGRENVYMNGTILGMKRREIAAKFDEIVAFSELEKFIDTPVKRYSSGMYVRLAFAVAAHLDPEIMLVDEVLAVGDAVFQKKCLGKMKEVAGKGRTVIFVSHNMPSVESLTRYALYLECGQIILYDKTADVISKYLSHKKDDALCADFLTPQNERNIVQKISLYNSTGDSKTQILFGETFSVIIEADEGKIKKGDDYSIRFYSERGAFVAAANSRITSHCVVDAGRVKIIFSDPTLTPGFYSMTFAVYNKTIGDKETWESCIKFEIEDIAFDKANPCVVSSSCCHQIKCKWKNT